MCGIIYKKQFDKGFVNSAIKRQYFKQKSRGNNGFGLIAINKGKIQLVRSIYEHDIMRNLKVLQSKEVMFHHRFPTSTENSTKTNHPIECKLPFYSCNYYLVHNGIIHNDDDVKKEHEQIGIKYSTEVGHKFNDSEALLHELVLCIEGVKQKSEFSAKGSIAFILLQTDKLNRPLNLYFGRNYSNPLKMDYDEKEFLSLSSEGVGKDHKDIEAHTLFKFNYAHRTITQETFTFSGYYPGYDTTYNSERYGGHNYFDDHGRYGDLRGWNDDDDDMLIGIRESSKSPITNLLPPRPNIVTASGAELVEMIADKKDDNALQQTPYIYVIHTINNDMELHSFDLFMLERRELNSCWTVAKARKKMLENKYAHTQNMDDKLSLTVQTNNCDVIFEALNYDGGLN